MVKHPETLKQPFLEKTRVEARLASLGLGDHAADEIKTFIDSSEFIGLGSFCAVSYGLQALGLKRRSYPFDWLRSPLDGILSLYENEFEDFLTFTTPRPSALHAGDHNTTYAQARWGGSFWHHDPECQKVASDFKRRIERLLGLGDDVLPQQRRVFVRGVNSTAELRLINELYDVLCKSLPDARVQLLVLIDLQSSEEAIRLESLGDDVIFYRIDGGIFAADDYSSFSMEACVDNYARGIAYAVKQWTASTAGSVAAGDLCTLADVSELLELVDQMDGGSAGVETYWPRRFKGHAMCIKRPPRMRLFKTEQSRFNFPQPDAPTPSYPQQGTDSKLACKMTPPASPLGLASTIASPAPSLSSPLSINSMNSPHSMASSPPAFRSIPGVPGMTSSHSVTELGQHWVYPGDWKQTQHFGQGFGKIAQPMVDPRQGLQGNRQSVGPLMRPVGNVDKDVSTKMRSSPVQTASQRTGVSPPPLYSPVATPQRYRKVRLSGGTPSKPVACPSQDRGRLREA